MFVLNADLSSPDQAYPHAMTMLPAGIKGLVFVRCCVLAIIISHLRPVLDQHAIELKSVSFKTKPSFNFATLMVSLFLVAFYATW